MTHEQIIENINSGKYGKDAQGFFEDLVDMFALDPSDPRTLEMYATAWNDSLSVDFLEVYWRFSDLVEMHDSDMSDIGHVGYDAFEVGDWVHDDLTGANVQLLRISSDPNGNIGYWINSDYLEGGRHPWEISKIKEKKDENRND